MCLFTLTDYLPLKHCFGYRIHSFIKNFWVKESFIRQIFIACCMHVPDSKLLLWLWESEHPPSHCTSPSPDSARLPCFPSLRVSSLYLPMSGILFLNGLLFWMHYVFICCNLTRLPPAQLQSQPASCCMLCFHCCPALPLLGKKSSAYPQWFREGAGLLTLFSRFS